VDDEQETCRITAEMIQELAGGLDGCYGVKFGGLRDDTREFLHRQAAATQDEIADLRCASMLAAREDDLQFAAWLARQANDLEVARLSGWF
jgi:hypothetical protein